MKTPRPGKMIQEVLGSIFKKPATLDYPRVKTQDKEVVRGEIKFESLKCIGCQLCMKDCPSNAIIIRKVGEKKFEAEFDLSKCIYCGQCVDSCPKKALKASHDFELAAIHRDTLKVIFHAPAPENPVTEGEKKV